MKQPTICKFLTQDKKHRITSSGTKLYFWTYRELSRIRDSNVLNESEIEKINSFIAEMNNTDIQTVDLAKFYTKLESLGYLENMKRKTISIRSNIEATCISRFSQGKRSITVRPALIVLMYMRKELYSIAGLDPAKYTNLW